MAVKYYCRMIANLDQKYSQEMRKNLTQKLQADYELFKNRKSRSPNLLFDNRIRNFHYIIEFTKFRLILPNFLLNLVSE